MAVDVDWEVLAAFRGGEVRYKWWTGGLLLTEGAHYLSAHGAGWLIDVIASAQLLAAVRAEEFQVWTLQLDADGGGCTVTCRPDAGGRVRYEQQIEYTDFPRDITLWVADRTLLLPSEY